MKRVTGSALMGPFAMGALRLVLWPIVEEKLALFSPVVQLLALVAAARLEVTTVLV